MSSTRISLKRSLLLSALFAVSLLSGDVLAQGTTTGNTQTTANTNTNTQNTNTQRTSTPAAPSTPNTRTSTTTQATSPVSLPPLGVPTPSTTTGPPPTGLPGLPTLSKTLNTEIGTFPPPTVPPTANAPFMNHSTLPDGTVFIAVGAILGAFGAAILAWRGIVACLLHRSVERAAHAQHVANDKASFPAPPAQFYKFLERDPSPVGGAAAAAVGGRSRKSYRGAPSTASASQTNLFFSPTAAPGGGTGIVSANNRDSRFLPSGFYAAASPVPGHNTGNSISMSTLRPSSRGRPGVGPSPPGSPRFDPRRNMSSTSVDRPGSSGGRAPSAFLDDLLDDQQNGPPPPMPHHYPSGPDGQYYTQSPSPPGHRGY